MNNASGQPAREAEMVLRVLLIEDSPEDADLVQYMLGRSVTPYEIVWATRLAEGLERLDGLAQHPIDIILLDLSLPDSQGLDTYTKVQNKAVDLPVVALTGLDDERVALRAVGEGLQDYLVKGEIESRQLNRTIRHAIERQQLRRDNRELKEIQAELEAKNAELERFTYTVSHDLKSPLFTIQGFLGYLERDMESGDKARQAKDIEHIRGAVGKMQRLLDELLELSRIGRVVNPPTDVHLTALARDAADLVATQLTERDIHLTIAPDLPTVRGDHQRLLEVFQNLLENAVRYMPADQPEPKIEIITSATSESEQLHTLEVRDNGAGIAPEYHEKIFGLFEKLDPKSQGTGIGLALVKRIIEVHGGDIWVESEGLGHGASFVFTLAASPSPSP